MATELLFLQNLNPKFDIFILKQKTGQPTNDLELLGIAIIGN